ncbi:hypothetical protein ACLOJK_023902 [Asimina triloba]
MFTLIKSYYGISRNLLVKFKDDSIDETPTLADVLSSDSAIGSMLDMTVRTLPGDHGLPLQQMPRHKTVALQAFLDVPPAVADAINQGGELLSNLTMGTPLETMAKDVSSTLGTSSMVGWSQISKDFDLLVDAVASWMKLTLGRAQWCKLEIRVAKIFCKQQLKRRHRGNERDPVQKYKITRGFKSCQQLFVYYNRPGNNLLSLTLIDVNKRISKGLFLGIKVR